MSEETENAIEYLEWSGKPKLAVAVAALKEENEQLKLNLKLAGGALQSLCACNVIDEADRVSFDDENGGRLTITIGGILDDIDASLGPKEPANAELNKQPAFDDSLPYFQDD